MHHWTHLPPCSFQEPNSNFFFSFSRSFLTFVFGSPMMVVISCDLRRALVLSKEVQTLSISSSMLCAVGTYTMIIPMLQGFSFSLAKRILSKTFQYPRTYFFKSLSYIKPTHLSFFHSVYLYYTVCVAFEVPTICLDGFAHV